MDWLKLTQEKHLAKLSADVANEADPSEYDLVALSMQEPEYQDPAFHSLLDRVANAKVPCISFMNMPPLPYLARIPCVELNSLRKAILTQQFGTNSIHR